MEVVPVRRLGWTFLATAFLCVAYVTHERFRYPDMTETRLFLEYWPACVGAIVLAVAGSLLVWGDE